MDLESPALNGQDFQDLSDAEEASDTAEDSDSDEDGSEEAQLDSSSTDDDGEPLDAHQTRTLHALPGLSAQTLRP